jgi:DNA-directed RNA polymerase subunit RPC12/RpoP
VSETTNSRATCSSCGSIVEDEGDLPSGWSLVTNERGVGLVCATCTRTNIRSIEAKLPEEWWE